jgi:FkbM family methyltransferase
MSIFLPSLKNSGHLDNIDMTLCNVGSRKLEASDDYGSKGWSIFAPNLTIYGFDADSDACDLANANLLARQINWTEEHLPFVLSDVVGERTLYVTKHPACSSLYPPNEDYIIRFKDLAETSSLDYTLEVETTTLDTFCQEANLQYIDFLQVDVQGADLDVLKGSAKVLSTVLAIQIEIEFSQLYQGQPLFADVDRFLRNYGFTLFDLKVGGRSRKRSPIVSNIHPKQWLWGDAYYFYDLLDVEHIKQNSDPARLFKLACVADVMEFPDYSLEILEYLTLNYGHDPMYNFADHIFESLLAIEGLDRQQVNSLEIINSLRHFLIRYQ